MAHLHANRLADAIGLGNSTRFTTKLKSLMSSMFQKHPQVVLGVGCWVSGVGCRVLGVQFFQGSTHLDDRLDVSERYDDPHHDPHHCPAACDRIQADVALGVS